MPLTVHIASFGFSRSGLPGDPHGNGGGFVFDCRFLPNPVHVRELAPLSGKDPEVVAFLETHDVLHEFCDRFTAIIDAAVDSYRERDYDNLIVNFGCTGGQRAGQLARRALSGASAAWPVRHGRCPGP